MKVHQIVRDGDGVVARTLESATAPLPEMAGTRLDGVGLWQYDLPWGRLEVVELAAGASLPLHSAEQPIFCQVLSGSGRLGLPDGSELSFAAPDLFVLDPDTEHSWQGIEQPVVLSICVVGATA